MTIKSLLLGSAAVLALGTSAQAADPIAVALDTCDLLNITGLTISSESNCLKFSGEVSYKWEWRLDNSTTTSTLDWKLAAEATADSDFGPAMTHISLVDNANTTDVIIDKAYVAIGDASSTVLYAGKKGSIAKTGDDDSFTALFSLDQIVDTNDEGISLGGGVATGGYVLQASASLGDGVNAGFGLEDLGTANSASLVGTVGVDQDWGTAHATFVFDDIVQAANVWAFHAGATFNVDDMSLRGAFETESGGTWSAVLSAKAAMDMFTLAAGVEFDNASQWEAAVSGVAEVDDTTTLTVAARFDDNSDWDIALKGAFKVSDTLTASAKVNFDESSVTTLNTDLDWAPGGGATVNVGFDAVSTGATTFSTKFKKTFE